jgi:hypothetical protein
MQYQTDTTAVQTRKQTNQAFAEATRRTENVNSSLKLLLCPPDSSGKASATGAGCWPMLFIPQVKLCNDSTLRDDANPEKGCVGEYGVREAPIGMKAYFDFLRYVFSENILKNTAFQLQTTLNSAALSTAAQDLAASEALYRLSAARLPINSSPVQQNIDPAIKDFQVNYLNCRNIDPAHALREYAKALSEQSSGDSKIGIELTSVEEISKTTNTLMAQFKLPAETAENKSAFRLLIDVSMGCTANQTIPVFDPKITVGINNRCTADDANAFYAMASYDVAQSATRDVYRYLNTRLKQVYARLLNEAGAGLKATDTDTPPDSPELRRRLATVVKEVMIPWVESQLDRLDEADKTRGEFSKRVQRIYADHEGCVYETNNKGQGDEIPN